MNVLELPDNFFKYGERITDIAWGDTKEEVYRISKGYIDAIYDPSMDGLLDKYVLIASFSFIEGNIHRIRSS